MAKFAKAVDIWALDEGERLALQPGQRVYAGERDQKGTFYGEGAVTVVAWDGNAKGRWASYHRALAD